MALRRIEWETVFVTGGAGYIGSHCIVELLNAGYKVIAIDNFANCVNGNGEAPSLKRVEKITGKKVTFYQCDLLDRPKLAEIFDNHKIDCVIHFAAMKAVGESMQLPLLYYKNNLVGTINLLEVMEEHNCCNLVFSSSCTVYGNPESLPITETHPTGNVTNVYGRTKYFIEEMLKDIIKADGHKWRIISLRYFNPVGAHQSGLIGEDPTKAFTNLMPYMAQVAIGKKPYLTIFGDDYDTIDGTGVRDYVHVMDLASGHVAAVQKLEADNHIGLQVFNLGIGEGLSVRQLVREFSRVTGQPVASVVQGRRVGDVDSLVCDGTRARAELSWTPTRDVTTMCEDFWRWQTMNPNGYRIESESKCNGSTSSNGIENKASMSNGIETNGH
uniref:UDP-glucose 4-epimerase n=1 Tax=Homalodisca liturata TaxID=320908 RepID=A0A1B6I0Q5_9HEMI